MVETDKISENSAFDDEVTTKQRSHVARRLSATHKDDSKTETKKSDVSLFHYNYFSLKNCVYFAHIHVV